MGGILALNNQWQLFGNPVFEFELFKVTNQFTKIPSWKSKILIGQFFNGNEVTTIRRIYPYKDTEKIIQMAIPEEFKKAGINARQIGILMTSPRYAQEFVSNWIVNLSYFDPG